MKHKGTFLDSDTLKIIAVVTMLIDHIGASLLETVLYSWNTGIQDYWYEADTVLRSIGRTAFPIFAFLLVEGLFHTRSRAKYFGRLLLFAVLSEVPFNLAFYGRIFYPDSQNVFWTLTIGYLVVWGMYEAQERFGDGLRPRIIGGIVTCLRTMALLAAGCFAAGAMRTDYQIFGVLLIFLFYFGQFAGISRVFICIVGYLLFLWEPYALFGFMLILFYNGKKRKRGKGFQYFFYLFYPVHLLILGLIRVVFLEN